MDPADRVANGEVDLDVLEISGLVAPEEAVALERQVYPAP